MVPINEYVALKMEVDRLNDLVEDLTGKLTKIHLQQGTVSSLEKGIVVSSGGFGRYVKVSDIVMIKAESNYSMMYLTDGTTLFTSKTLKYWSEKCDVNYLFRVHKSYLINGRMIQSFEPSKGKLILHGGIQAFYTAQGRKLLLGLK